MSDQLRDDALLALGRELQASGYRFTTITQASHRRVNNRPENAWARGITDVLGWSRPFRDGTLAPATVQLMRDGGILVPHEDGWKSTLRASTIGELLFFHSAYPTSEDDAVFFGPDTYRFVRALEACLAAPGNEVRRAVDIGCGSGPGALTVARRFPEAQVIGADINERALRLERLDKGPAVRTDAAEFLQHGHHIDGGRVAIGILALRQRPRLFALRAAGDEGNQFEQRIRRR